MSKLVQMLSEGEHPIVSERTKSANELKERIESGYVLLKFTETQGGTELGVKIDQKTEIEQTAFLSGTGNIRIIGDLTLDFVPVQLVAELDLSTLSGTGYLKILPVKEHV